ncbi:hypothetical protein [Chitinophaga alhagiae]|uniref:hypothetical protein n=1 Tax=Chitinophaga alhagiae TaxID=2203219 RepID=UPI000E5A5A06|nr:hypothetical protein [Chitinophaga alhagiae]
MKKILLFMFLAGVTTMSYAQDSLRTKLKSKQVADLKLDEKQNKELQQINKSYIKSSQEVRTNTALSKEEKTKQLEALGAAREDKIKSVLNADQFEKWQNNRERTMARAEAYKAKRYKKDGRKHGERGEDMVKALGLTDAQGQELKNINKDFMAKAGELRKNSSLSREQRHEQMKSLNSARLEKIKLALGNEQYQKYDEWRKKERDHYKSMRKKAGMETKMKKKEATDNL